MSTSSLPAKQNSVRASDAEREAVVRVVQQAGADGRLTLTETEERLAGIYATRFRHELSPFTDDLPNGQGRPGARPWPGRPWPAWQNWPTRPRSRGPLVVHAAIVLVMAIVLITRWAVSSAPFFWPAFPLFWLVVSLVLHARFRGVRFPYRGSPVT
jgi:uncharacterized protein DUF1707